jgi:hypothetical protein
MPVFAVEVWRTRTVTESTSVFVVADSKEELERVTEDPLVLDHLETEVLDDDNFIWDYETSEGITEVYISEGRATESIEALTLQDLIPSGDRQLVGL